MSLYKDGRLVIFCFQLDRFMVRYFEQKYLILGKHADKRLKERLTKNELETVFSDNVSVTLN